LQAQILHLTNDGLLGYKQVGGVEGSTLVADLATSMPRPTDGGTTYTFPAVGDPLLDRPGGDARGCPLVDRTRLQDAFVPP
jgi:hypothetical protein